MSSSSTPYHCVLKAWHLYEPALLAFLRQQQACADSANDLLQEVFIKAMQQRAGFCQLDNPKAWLFRVARNLVIDKFRQSSITWETLLDDLPETPAENDTFAAMSQCLGRVLTELSAEDRDIIEQCDLHEVKQADYALQHGLSLPAVKSRLRRARLRLRETLTVSCQVMLDDQGFVTDFVPR